jgi:hypothetical protein
MHVLGLKIYNENSFSTNPEATVYCPFSNQACDFYKSLSTNYIWREVFGRAMPDRPQRDNFSETPGVRHVTMAKSRRVFSSNTKARCTPVTHHLVIFIDFSSSFSFPPLFLCDK